LIKKKKIAEVEKNKKKVKKICVWNTPFWLLLILKIPLLGNKINENGSVEESSYFDGSFFG
jgi:hypothetical protein